MNDNITKLNMVIKSLENDIEERNNLNLLAKKAIADTKKKIKALQKLEAKEREKFLITLFIASRKYLRIFLKNFIILTSFVIFYNLSFF